MRSGARSTVVEPKACWTVTGKGPDPGEGAAPPPAGSGEEHPVMARITAASTTDPFTGSSQVDNQGHPQHEAG
jgi:hypothetical protein